MTGDQAMNWTQQEVGEMLEAARALANERIADLEAQIVTDAAAYGDDRARADAAYEQRIADLEGEREILTQRLDATIRQRERGLRERDEARDQRDDALQVCRVYLDEDRLCDLLPWAPRRNFEARR